ncbi:MAG: helix-turn-helix transcriptional regulator [Proteobacteria bacterium]|nr:helix-turn-helix transcriptional regulator [Pseudomonadota bacterium]
MTALQTGEAAAGRRVDLHGEILFRRRLEGFVVTEGSYPSLLEIARHDHEHASICIVLSGGYEERFEARTREAVPGTVILHPEGEHHSEVHGPAHVRLLTIEVEPGVPDALRPVAGLFTSGWHRKDTRSFGLAARLRREIEYRDPHSSLVAETLIADMIDTLGRTRAAEAHGARWLKDVRDRLEAEGLRPPRLRELGELAGVHPVYLARAFRRTYGCSIGDYVRTVQVGHAILLLGNREQPLSQVAYEAGFSDQSHMTRLVRAQTGFTPAHWRRHLAN